MPRRCDPRDDFVLDMLRRVHEVDPSLTDQQLMRLAIEARAKWGGSRPYIARKPRQDRARRTRSSSEVLR